jgi:hypothetical protein
MALALAGAQAATGIPPASAADPVDIVNLDFSKEADQAKMTLNGTAYWVDGRLQLTEATGEAASAFLTTALPTTADYLATFQFEVRSLEQASPADGFMFVAQTTGPEAIGDGGGSLAYNTGDGSGLGVFSYGVEFNNYDGQGLGGGIDQTVAWNAFGQRFPGKYDQTRFPGLATWTWASSRHRCAFSRTR